MDLSFVILTWNSESYIEKCFDSLMVSLGDTEYSFEIFIVDNGSRDRTVEILKKYQTTYGNEVLKLIFLNKNVGTTVSRNMALKQVAGDYIVVMDSDVEVPEGLFEQLIGSINKSPDIGMVVPNIIYPSGKWQKSVDQFPTLLHKLNRFFRLRSIEKQEGDDEANRLEERTVDYAISAFWLFKKEVLAKVGLLDEKYFYAPEDVDYCLQVWKAGFQIVYLPTVTVVHHTQEISRGFKFNKAKTEHLKGLAYLFKKHRYFFVAPDYKSKVCQQSNLNVLFVAYYFPPESSSGSFRPLFFANHLLDLGCKIHVLTAQPANYLPEQPVDNSLLDKLSPKIIISRSKVVRPREWLISLRNRLRRKNSSISNDNDFSVGRNTNRSSAGFIQKIKDLITDVLATPDPHVGWIFSCVRMGRKIIRQDAIDVIWATGSPWSGLIAGVLIKKLTRKSLVLDFRDPWTSNPNFTERSSTVQFFDRYMEKFVINHADVIVANTPELKADFHQRYPALSDSTVVTITNGFEEYLTASDNFENTPKKLTITHTGALYFSRNPVQLLQATKNLILCGAIEKENLHIQFVGGIEIDDLKIKQLLLDDSLDGVVEVIPRVSYDEVQRYVKQSTVLLLMQPGFPLQVPRKLYEYMAAKKTLFCIADKGGATAGMMNRFDLGYVCENSVDTIEQRLLQLYQDWFAGKLSVITDSRCDDCLNVNLSKSLYRVFEKLSGNVEKEQS